MLSNNITHGDQAKTNSGKDSAIAIGVAASSIGNQSIALGTNAYAHDNSAVSFGAGSSATGIQSTATGSRAVANGDAASALGSGATATGRRSSLLVQNPKQQVIMLWQLVTMPLLINHHFFRRSCNSNWSQFNRYW